MRIFVMLPVDVFTVHELYSFPMKRAHYIMTDEPAPALTVADLVEKFGGTAKFAAWADVVPSAVSNWKTQNHIPSGYHLRLYLEARRRGITVSRELFGIGDDIDAA